MTDGWNCGPSLATSEMCRYSLIYRKEITLSKAKTLRSTMLGDINLRLVQKELQFYGLANGKIIVEGPSSDDVWRRLHDQAGKASPRYFGFDGAKQRFLSFFPSGFESPEYVTQERDDKDAARDMLSKFVPLEGAREGSGFEEPVLSVFRRTILLSPFEKTAMQNLLRGSDANGFVASAASFAESGSKADFNKLASFLRQRDLGKWTLATYLPFFWRPEAHMFLKPQATKDFAERVGHPLAQIYDAKLEFETYQSLLDLVAETERAIDDLKPQDKIDIQSFIWVVGNYQ